MDRSAVAQRSMWSSLAFRDFRLLWLANLSSNFAMQMQMVARGWLIYDMTASPMALTWVMLSFMLPSVIFSLAGGVLADRVHKRSVMIVSQVLNTAATVVMASMIYAGNIEFWDFIYFGVFNGTLLALSMPARSSMGPEIVGREHMVNAMALQSATFNLSRILGPAIAGGLIALLAAGNTSSMTSVGIVFFVIAGLYTASIGCTIAMRHRGKSPSRGTSALSDVVEGLRYMRQERLVLGLIAMSFVPMTFGFTVTFLMPAFNADVIGGGPEDLGLLMTGAGIGALAGSLGLARAGDIRGKGRVLFVAGYLWAVFVTAFALTESMPTALLFGAASGLAGSVMGSLNMSVVQLALPDAIRGRVMSIMMMTHGFMPIAVMPISAIAELVGIHAALVIAGLCLAVSMVLIRWWIPELAKIDTGHRIDPAGAGALDPRTR
jgi:MFS family permease